MPQNQGNITSTVASPSQSAAHCRAKASKAVPTPALVLRPKTGARTTLILKSNPTAINRWLVSFFFMSTFTVVQAQYAHPVPTLSSDSLKGSGLSDAKYKTPVFQETPVAALLQAAAPASIEIRRNNLSPSKQHELRALTKRLSEIDTAIAQYQRTIGAKSFQLLLRTLEAFVLRKAPRRSADLSEEAQKILALVTERREVNRRILGIEYPDGVIRPVPHAEPARSGDSSSNYHVYRSDETATGSVVVPSPPPCRQEARTRRVYRNVQEPNGFDGAGTPLYRNVYHAFPVTEMVTVCP